MEGRLNWHRQQKFSDELSRAAGAGGGVAIRTTRLPTINMTGYIVNSSNLYAVDYEPWSGTLTITFRSGSVYEYYGVPPSVFDCLLAAESPGRVYTSHLQSNYSHKRIL